METAERILEFIINYKARNDGNSPPYRRIAKETGIASTNTVSVHLAALEEMGFIKRGEDNQIMVVGGKWTAPEVKGVKEARQARPKKTWGLLSRVSLDELRRLRQRVGLTGAARACGVSPSAVKYHLGKAKKDATEHRF